MGTSLLLVYCSLPDNCLMRPLIVRCVAQVSCGPHAPSVMALRCISMLSVRCIMRMSHTA